MGFTRQDCLAYWEKRQPDHVLPKSACTFCPYHSNRQWLELYRAGGPDWERVKEMDALLQEHRQSLHTSGKPIDDVGRELDDADRLQIRLPGFDDAGWGNECAGVCGV